MLTLVTGGNGFIGRSIVAQLRTREPVYTLQERFSLAYLYHRFALNAALAQIGGEWRTNALAGDGQVPRQPVPLVRQQHALDAGCR